jgi:hypothetical protein
VCAQRTPFAIELGWVFDATGKPLQGKITQDRADCITAISGGAGLGTSVASSQGGDDTSGGRTYGTDITEINTRFDYDAFRYGRRSASCLPYTIVQTYYLGQAAPGATATNFFVAMRSPALTHDSTAATNAWIKDDIAAEMKNSRMPEHSRPRRSCDLVAIRFTSRNFRHTARDRSGSD